MKLIIAIAVLFIALTVFNAAVLRDIDKALDTASLALLFVILVRLENIDIKLKCLKETSSGRIVAGKTVTKKIRVPDQGPGDGRDNANLP